MKKVCHDLCIKNKLLMQEGYLNPCSFKIRWPIVSKRIWETTQYSKCD